ncbi:hypothetical protein FDK13_32285 [Dyadobacter frigoris]|uniref:Bacterial virulence domain-containing protein n=1 Tax=Dyadobacter frigoris TaxID=2576211 RepID=A0A4U6CU55_9BACT|nr:AcvB/VirJ family lysyl-phosphatidylglycerol hydrolase [Dyadobacter frigoris]TKT86558.1 hypothetical protein FDK13_32285 [Dyadobacter frigoris]
MTYLNLRPETNGVERHDISGMLNVAFLKKMPENLTKNKPITDSIKSHLSFIAEREKHVAGFSINLIHGNSQPFLQKQHTFYSENNNPAQVEMPLILLPLIFFISGDGGWTNFDQGLSKILVGNGMPVVGMNVQKYFWIKKHRKNRRKTSSNQ